MSIKSFVSKQSVRRKYRTQFLHEVDLAAPEVARDFGSLLSLRDEIYETGIGKDLIQWFFYTDEPVMELEKLPLFTGERFVGFFQVEGPQSMVRSKEKGSILDKNALAKLKTLIAEYSDITEKHWFSTQWLRNDVFRYLLVFDESKHGPEFSMRLVSQMPLLNPIEYPRYPTQYAADGSKVVEPTGVFRLPQGTHYIIPVGDPPFFYGMEWQMQQSEIEYRKYATEIFQMQLEKYVEETRTKWRSKGHKQKTKPLDLSSVKWLVQWTVKGLTKGEILELIDRENEENGSTYDIKSLEKAFRKLKDHGLPVRTGNFSRY